MRARGGMGRISTWIAGLLLGLAAGAALAQEDGPSPSQSPSPALLAAAAQMATDPAAALRVILPEARRGQPLAQFLVGEAYRLGQGREVEPRLARDWLAKAAANAEPRAALVLAEMDLVDGNPAGASGWLEMAMAMGDATAFHRRADMMVAGQGGAADPGGALALYGVALDLGDTGASLPMAELMLATPGGDARRARALVARAAAQGDAAAMTRLGLMYRDGIGGPADPVAAFALLQEAVSLGSPAGAVALAGEMAAVRSDGAGYWVNPVLALAYCLWAVRTDPALTGACDPIATSLGVAERAEAERLAAAF